MNLLVTAGNTSVPIDRVRCLTNVFTGRTGAAVALCAHERGHHVTLLTSHPEAVADLNRSNIPLDQRWTLFRYNTFDDLHNLMAQRIAKTTFDCVIHSAAVSDYLSGGIYAPAPGTRFDAALSQWQNDTAPPALLDRAAGKVKSDEPELWLRLVRAPKLIDRIRTDWGFRGLLVKFKLEVGRSDVELLEIAERSRRQSNADVMVANTYEDMSHYAFIGPLNGQYEKVSRRDLANRLLDVLEQLSGGQNNG
jgi:phosphopantothenoylcysteine synthetase/decarboxylase